MSESNEQSKQPEADVENSGLLSESMIGLGVACKLLRRCMVSLPEEEQMLKIEIASFENRLMKGPMYSKEIDDLISR